MTMITHVYNGRGECVICGEPIPMPHLPVEAGQLVGVIATVWGGTRSYPTAEHDTNAKCETKANEANPK